MSSGPPKKRLKQSCLKTFCCQSKLSKVENYEKGEVKELDCELPQWFNHLAVRMKVKAGSKIRNLVTFAVKKLNEPDVRQIIWCGAGPAIGKVISCAEITKNNLKEIYQVTDIHFKRVEEYWEPKVAGLERLKVNRDIPAIAILLSKDPLDPTLPGYQALEMNAMLHDSSSLSLTTKLSSTGKRRQQPSSMSVASSSDFAVLENRRQHPSKQSKDSKRPGKPSTSSVTHKEVGDKAANSVRKSVELAPQVKVETVVELMEVND